MAAGLSLVVSGCSSGGGEPAPADTGSKAQNPSNGAEGGDSFDSLYQAAIDNGETEVVMYGGLMPQLKPYFDAFSKKFPKISIQTQTMYGAALSSRVEQEITSGQRVADLVETGPAPSSFFFQQGYLDKYVPENTDVVKPWMIGPDEMFAWNALQPFGMIYNSDKLSPDTAPKSWTGLDTSEWKDKLTITDPTNPGGTAEAITMLMYNDVFAPDYIKSLVDNGMVIDADWQPEIARVESGQREVGLGLPFANYLTEKEKGANLGFVFPMSDANYLAPIGFLLLKDPPHPNAAKLLVAWSFSDEGQAAIGQSGYYGTQKGDLGTPEGLSKLSEVPHVVDIPEIANFSQTQNDAIEKLKAALN